MGQQLRALSAIACVPCGGTCHMPCHSLVALPACLPACVLFPTGQLNLIDLAGSERLSRSAVTGDRLKETQVGCCWAGNRMGAKVR